MGGRESMNNRTATDVTERTAFYNGWEREDRLKRQRRNKSLPMTSSPRRNCVHFPLLHTHTHTHTHMRARARARIRICTNT